MAKKSPVRDSWAVRHLAVFRLGNDRKTAEWAADVIGKAERLERHRSQTEGRDRSQTTSESTHDRYLYMPEELQNLPATCPEHGLQGIFVSEQYGVVDAADAKVSGAQLFGEMLLPPDEIPCVHSPSPQSALPRRLERRRFAAAASLSPSDFCMMQLHRFRSSRECGRTMTRTLIS